MCTPITSSLWLVILCHHNPDLHIVPASLWSFRTNQPTIHFSISPTAQSDLAGPGSGFR